MADNTGVRPSRRLPLGLGLFLAALALVLAACSGSDAVQAGGSTDDASNAATTDGTSQTDGTTDTSGSTSTDDGSATVPDSEGQQEPESDAPAAQPVSFATEVLPILENNCATCHATGGPGSPHMELATAIDAAAFSFPIGRVVDSGEMPPWPASELSVPFVGDHSLTDAEVDTIVAWVDQGGGLDLEPDTPIRALKEVQRITDPDLVLTSAKGPYQGSTEVLDDYRCVIFDPELTETQWILASHFEPDQVEVAHHAIVSVASAGLRQQADARDAAEDGVGWTCYGGTGLNASGDNYEFNIAGWAPGAPPSRQPDGYGVPLQPGDFIVVQLHYHFDETAPADLSRMVFDLASPEEVAAQGGAYKTLQGQLYLGPAEIPCYAGDTNPLCDRTAAQNRVRELYGARVAAYSDFFNNACGVTPRDFADMTDGTAWSTCDLPVRNPGIITSLTGHMHELGLSLRLTLNPDTPDELILLDIPDWDFDWQFGYRPVDEIIIERGDVIRIDCAWNRERAPYEAVGYILWADGTGDEMCYSNITTAPLN